MFIFYNLIILVFSLVSAPFFLLHKRGKISFLQRFGFWNLKGDFTWIHLASFGEARGIQPFVEILLKEKHKVLITSTSPTALNALKNYDIEHRLVPFDFYFFYQFAFRNIKISKTIIIEKEFWLSLLYFASKKSTVYFLNTKFDYKRMKVFRFFPQLFIKPLRKASLFLVQFESDLQSLKSLGINNAIVNGNTKFDIVTCKSKVLFNNTRPLMVLASIRKNEEVFFKDILVDDRFNFIIAPRHTEDFEYFDNFLARLNLDFIKRSQFSSITSKSVVLLDSLGELASLYTLNSLVFVGGSLVPKFGGHNPLEPMIAGANIMMGKYYYNQQDLVDTLVEKKLIDIVESNSDIHKKIDLFLSDNENTKNISISSIKFAKEFNGASQRAYYWIFK